YKYGFTEAAYNFQNDNYGKGGAGNDRVKISIQDRTGSNNANFATPAGGTVPSKMTLSSTSTVMVFLIDSGGGTGRCLQTTEVGGTGEGWSDVLADITEINSATLAGFTLGSFVTGKVGNIRNYPYSTNKTTNPLTYGSLATLTEVHNIGEVWAPIWHEIVASLLTNYGYTADRFNAEGTGGNIVAMHPFIDSFQLQPCNTTFMTARDAIIQADANRYRGANKCLLWQAFAKRGLGTGK
ncbi:hypothetical protein FRC11_001433, partial [Ceratobasidium sp. 423]